LSVTAAGPVSRWFTRTKEDFGDSHFADPGQGFPFTVSNGILSIEAKKFPDGWKSGILASVDPHGQGFSQQYGYFEMRAKFPKGPGTWPGFWMLSTASLTDPQTTTFEIDIAEQYGHAPRALFTTIHWWPPKGKGEHRAVGSHCEVADMSADFHTYGLLWTEQVLIFYFDRQEVWRQPTPPEARTPMYLLVNLALGSGWPITNTPNPSTMLVDYVRAYATKTANASREAR
jgi:beta-glucanase (GH16 family)